MDELNHGSENGSAVEVERDVFRTSGTGERSTGAALLFQQFWGLMLKKILYSLRRWKLTLSQVRQWQCIINRVAI